MGENVALEILCGPVLGNDIVLHVDSAPENILAPEQMLINNNLIKMDLGQTNAIHGDVLDFFSNNFHYVYFTFLKPKPVFQVSSVEKRRLLLGLPFLECSSL